VQTCVFKPHGHNVPARWWENPITSLRILAVCPEIASVLRLNFRSLCSDTGGGIGVVNRRVELTYYDNICGWKPRLMSAYILFSVWESKQTRTTDLEPNKYINTYYGDE